MNIHPEIINQISFILYMICGALYVFIATRFKSYLKESHYQLVSFWAFIIMPFYAAVIRPDLDLILLLISMQFGFIFSILLGSLSNKRFSNVVDFIFGGFSTLLLLLFMTNKMPSFYYALQLHWVGLINAIFCFIILLIQGFNPKNLLPKSTLLFLTAASILAAFKAPMELQLVIHFVYVCGLLDWIRHQSNALENHVLTQINKTKKIEKDFNDAVRKEVNKHMFYHELSKDKIKTISQTDDLTKSLNKKAFLDHAAELILNKTPFGIIMFDIDKFKTINDSLGHIAGDVCLKTLANIARQCIRDNDILARYGGDEFIIILPNSDLANALRVAERFRSSVAKTADPHFTISLGVSCYPSDSVDLGALIHKADKGLYESKNKGRNTVSYSRN